MFILKNQTQTMNSQELSTNHLADNGPSQDIASQQQNPHGKPTPGDVAQIKSLLRSDDERDRNKGHFLIKVANFNPRKF